MRFGNSQSRARRRLVGDLRHEQGRVGSSGAPPRAPTPSTRQFRDAVGNSSPAYSDRIYLDTTAPTLSYQLQAGGLATNAHFDRARAHRGRRHGKRPLQAEDRAERRSGCGLGLVGAGPLNGTLSGTPPASAEFDYTAASGVLNVVLDGSTPGEQGDQPQDQGPGGQHAHRQPDDPLRQILRKRAGRSASSTPWAKSTARR